MKPVHVAITCVLTPLGQDHLQILRLMSSDSSIFDALQPHNTFLQVYRGGVESSIQGRALD